MRFDIVHAADPRFRGGTSSALRTEIIAASRFGVTSALLPFIGIGNGNVRVFDLRTAETIERLSVPSLTGEEEVEADLVLAHHPFVFERMPSLPIRLKTKCVVCVVQHPPFDGDWIPEYD